MCEGNKALTGSARCSAPSPAHVCPCARPQDLSGVLLHIGSAWGLGHRPAHSGTPRTQTHGSLQTCRTPVLPCPPGPQDLSGIDKSRQELEAKLLKRNMGPLPKEFLKTVIMPLPRQNAGRAE